MDVRSLPRYKLKASVVYNHTGRSDIAPFLGGHGHSDRQVHDESPTPKYSTPHRTTHDIIPCPAHSAIVPQPPSHTGALSSRRPRLKDNEHTTDALSAQPAHCKTRPAHTAEPLPSPAARQPTTPTGHGSLFRALFRATPVMAAAFTRRKKHTPGPQRHRLLRNPRAKLASSRRVPPINQSMWKPSPGSYRNGSYCQPRPLRRTQRVTAYRSRLPRAPVPGLDCRACRGTAAVAPGPVCCWARGRAPPRSW